MVTVRRFAALAVVCLFAPFSFLQAQFRPPQPAPPPGVDRALATITTAAFASRLDALAHDSTRGRESPSPELDKAAEWVAQQFRAAGLEPGGANGTWFQPFTMELRRLDSTTTMSAEWRGRTVVWTLGQDLIFAGSDQPAAIRDAPVVFLAGIPTDTANPFGDLPLRGAVVLQVVSVEQAGGRWLDPLSSRARALGAAAYVVAVDFPAATWRRYAARFPETWTLPGVTPRGGAPFSQFGLRPGSAAALLRSVGQSEAPPTSPVPARLLPGVTISLAPHYTVARSAQLANVVGVLPGRDPALRGEAVVFTSHMDHVGVIPGRCRPSRALPADSTCNGADDNASGTVGIIQLAEAFAALDVRPARTLVFAAFTAEERGLFGSRWYVEHPVVPLEQTVAVINLDMIARDSAGAIGTVGKDYSSLGAVVDAVARAHPELGVPVDREQYYPQSDHYPFAQRGVPALFFNSTAPADLHTAADNPDRANSEQAARTVRLAFLAALEVANAAARPTWDSAARARVVVMAPSNRSRGGYGGPGRNGARPRPAGPPPTPEALANDTGALRHANGRVPPVAFGIRAAAPPRIDGRFDDAVWAGARPVGEFTQQQPHDGAPVTERTEVRVAYDDDAIYIAARMFDREPARVAAQLSRRDNITQSDFFEVDFDSYHDHQTGFQFYVNPVGVRRDLVSTSDFPHGDTGWDPVWEAATTRDSLGWTAEMRIPLSQLRFNAAGQVWGMNFYRYLQRRGEVSMWAYFTQTDAGYASNFGHMLGLANLPEPRRLEVLPYVAAIEERLDPGAPGNPFNDGSREEARVGMDVQYGITSNLTLNATVNPDFGQVEGDPAVMNLTAYETQFAERRPFFVEGSGIFWAVSPGMIPVNGPNFLYSRRIGRAPQGSADWRGPGAFTDQPDNSTILGAAKLTGRTRSGWSLGVLEAVTAPEYATVDSAGTRFRDLVEPLSNYAVVRARRDVAGGGTTYGFTATAVNRRLSDARLDFLRGAAYTGGLDASRRFANNRYSAFAALSYSYVTGDTLAMQATQRSSARYFQRPDASHLRYDPARTGLFGWYAALGAGREQGTFLYAAGINASSPGFEINDLGYQQRSDRINMLAQAAYRWTRPGRVFRTAQLQLQLGNTVTFGGERVVTRAVLQSYAQLRNFWSLQYYAQVNQRSFSDALLRGGPLGIAPRTLAMEGNVQTDSRRPLRFMLDVGVTRNEIGYRDYGIFTQLAWRPMPTLSLTVGPTLIVARTPQQYVTAVADSTATAMYGRRYLFGEIRQHTLDFTTRLDWTLSPSLTVQLYTQPFVASGEYLMYKELTRPRSTDYVVYGQTPGSTDTPVLDGEGRVVAHALDPDGAGPRPEVTIPAMDFNYRSLRGNAVIRWEYRPGSTLFFVWTQSCSAYESDAGFSAGRDLRHLCQGRSDNVFAVKLNYWMSR